MKRTIAIAVATAVLLSLTAVMSMEETAAQTEEVALTSPQGGEIWYSGGKYEVSWSTEGIQPAWQGLYLWSPSFSMLTTPGTDSWEEWEWESTDLDDYEWDTFGSQYGGSGYWDGQSSYDYETTSDPWESYYSDYYSGSDTSDYGSSWSSYYGSDYYDSEGWGEYYDSWSSYYNDWASYYVDQADYNTYMGSGDWASYYAGMAEDSSTKSSYYGGYSDTYDDSSTSEDDASYAVDPSQAAVDWEHYNWTDYYGVFTLYDSYEHGVSSGTWTIPEELPPGEYAMILGVYDESFAQSDPGYQGHWVTTGPFLILPSGSGTYDGTDYGMV